MSTNIAMDGRRRVNKSVGPLPQLFMESEERVTRSRKDPGYQSTSTPGTMDQTPESGKKFVEENNNDSGLGGWESTDSRPRYRDLSFKGNPNLWETISSPILDLKKAIKGRPSFIDPGPGRNQFQHLVHPYIKVKDLVPFNWKTQSLIRGGILLVMAGSLMVSVLMKSNLSSTHLDGKRSSIKYGTEQRLLNLQRTNRILNVDIKDEAGRVLGGKHASIQFAHDLNKGSGSTLPEPNPSGRIEREASDSTDPIENDVRRKVIKAEISEPEPIPEPDAYAEPEPEAYAEPEPEALSELEPAAYAQPEPEALSEPEPLSEPSLVVDINSGGNQFSIFELSRKIEELSALLKMENMKKEDAELETQIDNLKNKKRNLVQKLQQSNKVIAQDLNKKISTESTDPVPEPSKSAGASIASIKPGKPAKQLKTKVKNPLTEPLVGKPNISIKKKVEEDDEAVVEDEVDPVDIDLDYPDDPKFRKQLDF